MSTRRLTRRVTTARRGQRRRGAPAPSGTTIYPERTAAAALSVPEVLGQRI